MNEELQLAVMGYIVATKKQPKSEQEINTIAQQVMQLKQQDPQQYNQLVQLGQQARQQMAQQQSAGIKAKLGAKLEYINKLKGICPEGTEKVYLAKGGCMCKQKAKEGTELKSKKMNAIKKFKAEKAQDGTKFNEKEERRQYAKDMKSAKDQAARDSILINKYSDLETLEKSKHKGSYKHTKDGSIWTPDRSKYKTEKKACGSKLKKK